MLDGFVRDKNALAINFNSRKVNSIGFRKYVFPFKICWMAVNGGEKVFDHSLLREKKRHLHETGYSGLPLWIQNFAVGYFHGKRILVCASRSFRKKNWLVSARDFMWGSLSSWGAAWLRSLCIREVNSRGVCSQYYFFDCSPNGNTENSLLQCKYKGSGLDADVYRVLIRHSNFNYLDTLIECNFNFADEFYVWFPNKLKIDNWILAFNIDSKIFEIFCWK